MKLSNDTLSDLPEGIERPRYDRATLTPGIVHIGLGNFHRAHQAWYLHRLMQQGKALDWAIVGAGVRAPDAQMRERLLAQDCLTTLIELDPKGISAEVTGSMIDFVPVEEGNGPLIAQMSDPAIRIVSLTVTEGGYYRDPSDGSFAADHDDIRHDATNPDAPRTAFGAIIAAQKARRAAGTGPFTVQSCDNLQGNGDIARDTVVSLARLSDADLADWIDAKVSFPNAMVDCIVPATGPSEIAKVKELGIDDAAPVTHENFRQWVIQDDFCAGRPPWEEVGATMTDDVHTYESMKLRLLNAGHQVLATPGEILGVETIHGCMEHPLIGPFFRKVLSDEVAPHVDAVPGMSAQDYIDLISTRFANPKIRDTVRRVAFDGASRHPGFLLPTVRDAVQANTPIAGLALVEALWARMCGGTRADGSRIEPNDPNWDALNKVALAAKDNPMAWLEQSQYYGKLASDRRFADAFTAALSDLWDRGCEAVLADYLSRDG
ncbi:mannitol dehydrogenase family protein [Maribius pontilimi]|uniref:Mannitol dehydrogenase family protein n=1 Tax=Palleronia pontilimi TaxID=1964209 RepID=A0A934MBD1_9RHOB|nr:mannitol dehydrogenase family protein [Palleronia pontilimi]MBJ3761385.1 mannitol dehydrogenase family protein [Palleronia pontilimi]